MPQVEQWFAVLAARRIYATADQLAVAETDHLHLIRACDAVLTAQTNGENRGVAAAVIYLNSLDQRTG